MSDITDFELLKSDAPPIHKPAVRPAAVIGVVLGVAAAVAAYWMYGRSPAPAPAYVSPATQPAESAKPVAKALGGEPERVVVPPLDETDALVRELVRKITSHPSAAALLATTGLVRTFVASVANVVEGVTPARHLRVLRPATPFTVVQKGGATFIDPHSYDRYNAVAAAAASIDPVGAARVYATLKPRIEEAYGQLGLPPQAFDRAFERAIVLMLQVPVIDAPIRVETKGGTGYRYADAKLEGLTSAQKQVLRMGPQNVRAVQSSLRAIAAALGIPSSRLH